MLRINAATGVTQWDQAFTCSLIIDSMSLDIKIISTEEVIIASVGSEYYRVFSRTVVDTSGNVVTVDSSDNFADT